MSLDCIHLRGVDPACRYFRSKPDHECVRRDGEPVRFGEPCWYESRTALCEEAGLLGA